MKSTGAGASLLSQVSVRETTIGVWATFWTGLTWSRTCCMMTRYATALFGLFFLNRDAVLLASKEVTGLRQVGWNIDAC